MWARMRETSPSVSVVCVFDVALDAGASLDVALYFIICIDMVLPSSWRFTTRDLFSMSSTCYDATMAQSMVSMLFTGAIILRCQKTLLDEFISILVTMLKEVSFIGLLYRVSAEIRISSAEKLSHFFFDAAARRGFLLTTSAICQRSQAFS